MRLKYDDERTPPDCQNYCPERRRRYTRSQEEGTWQMGTSRWKNRGGRGSLWCQFQRAPKGTRLEAEDFTDIAGLEIEDKNGCAKGYIIYIDDFEGEAQDTSNEYDEFKWVQRENYLKLDFRYHSVYSVPAVGTTEKYLEKRGN